MKGALGACLALWLALGAVCFTTAPASAQNLNPIRIEVLETDPASPATLDYWEPFYLRIPYETDRPMRVRAEAWFAGQRVTSTTSGAWRNPPGRGETMFWIAYTDPAQVDKIVVRAEDDSGRQVLAQVEFPVQLAWTGKRPATKRPRAAWVSQMTAELDLRSKQEMQAYQNRPTAWLGSVLVMILMWSVPGYFVVQVLLLRRWQDGWRKAAVVPIGPMILVLGYTVYAFLAGSNIFPLVLIFTAPFALAYLIVLIFLRRARLRPA